MWSSMRQPGSFGRYIPDTEAESYEAQLAAVGAGQAVAGGAAAAARGDAVAGLLGELFGNDAGDGDGARAGAKLDFGEWLRRTTTLAAETEINVQLGEFHRARARARARGRRRG